MSLRPPPVAPTMIADRDDTAVACTHRRPRPVAPRDRTAHRPAPVRRRCAARDRRAAERAALTREIATATGSADAASRANDLLDDILAFAARWDMAAILRRTIWHAAAARGPARCA